MSTVSDPRQVSKALLNLPKAISFEDLLRTPPNVLAAIYSLEEVVMKLSHRIADHDPDFSGNTLGESLHELAEGRRVIATAYRGCTATIREIHKIVNG